VKRTASVVLLAAAAAGWASWLAAAPALAAGSSPRPVLWAAAVTYRAGAFICHQQDARSLHVAGVRMPVCARCFGLYAGAAIGAVLAAAWILSARRRRRQGMRLPLARWRWAAAACALPTLAAWAAEHLFGLAVPGAARAVLALPLGMAIAAIAALWAGGASFDDTSLGSALH
jgi:hypothetical protein